jgi:hypothetical protein
MAPNDLNEASTPSLPNFCMSSTFLTITLPFPALPAASWETNWPLRRNRRIMPAQPLHIALHNKVKLDLCGAIRPEMARPSLNCLATGLT